MHHPAIQTAARRYYSLTQILQSIFEGTGMGLAICKRIVDRHGGSIHVVSQPNKGTSFVILLPEKNKERRNNSTPSPEFTTV